MAGFLGWLGPLVPCGVDRVAECIAWSGAASAVAWAAFILFFVGLAVWQLREWRREPIPPDR